MKPGHTNNPHGRPKGSVNKNRQALIDKAEELGVDPFEVLLLFAKGDYASLGYEKHQIRVTKDGGTEMELTISPELRQRSAKDACEYLHAKRKAVEISSEDGKEPIVFKLAYPDT